MKPDPDFSRLRKVLLRQGEPDRVPFFELSIDAEIIEAVIKKPMTKLDINRKEDGERYLKWLIEFYYITGYDYVPLWFGFPQRLLFQDNILLGKDTALISQRQRIWQNEQHGIIETREDFKKYRWPNLDLVDWSLI